MSTIRLQGPDNFGGFSHAGESYAPDEDGVIEVPAHVPTEVLRAHGLKAAAVKPTPKPLAKAAKGGETEPETDAEPKKSEEAKPAQKGAKAAKGGEQ